MLLAVDFWIAELGGMTIEVDDEAVERNLPPEFRAMESGASQTRP